jgi:putative ABC transport system substrate-binding protein
MSYPVLTWAGAANTQANSPLVIAWLHASTREPNLYGLNAFNEGMAALGWHQGVQYVVEERWAGGRIERLPVLAQELSAGKPAVIVATPTISAKIASQAAPATPVVLAQGDPMQTGLVKSLSRPGGMVTGSSNVNSEISDKVVELLMQSLPKLRRVGFLVDASLTSYADNVRISRRVAAHYRLEPVFGDMATPEDIKPVMARLAKEKVQAVVILASAWFPAYHQEIINVALAQRWPVVSGLHIFAEAGALFSYGADRVALYRRAAYFVDRILKGAKPGDLPIEQPTKFELVINMKTAKALRITIPSSILVRADRVIE